MTRIEYFRDEGGGWRFRVRAGNSEIVMTSEAYTRARDAHRGFIDLCDVLSETVMAHETEESCPD